MRRRGLGGTVFFAVLVLVLAAALAASYFIFQHNMIINGQLYSKEAAVVDLQDREMTVEEYEALAWRLPSADIQWLVPFQGGMQSSTLQELTVSHLSSEDISMLRYFPNLTSVNAEACTDYPAIMQLMRTYPELTVRYFVPVGGQQIASDAAAVTVTELKAEDAAMLAYLPKLESIDGTRCRDYTVLRQLEKEHPDWNVSYTDTIAGKKISEDAVTLELTGTEYDELYYGLAAMPKLKTVTIHTPKADGAQMLKLREAYPDLDIQWDVEHFGTTFPGDAEEVDISFHPLDRIETAKEVAAKFPNLKKLIVEAGAVSDEDMAAFRDEVRSSYKVVWTVYFSPKCKARTDETYFMPIKQGEYYFEERNVYPLRYCEDMICVDIGHATVKTVDFVYYMPHLKYLVLAWTQVTDITPLETCKELIFLELDNGICHDFTPLLGCTALEDLKLNGQMWHPDYTPIFQMTWLKTLWVTDSPYDRKMKFIESLPNTRVVINEVSGRTGQGWRNLQNYYDMRDILGMYYMY